MDTIKRFYWAAYCYDDRLLCISRVQDCVMGYGFIMDFKFFSDLAMSLCIEIEEGHLRPLFEDLIKIIDITIPDEWPTGPETECMLLINITFTKGTGDLKVEVPMVPG
jgi:hypothetical protein